MVADLYLACACARGDARAIAIFGRRYASVIDGVRARFGRRAPAADELWSLLAPRLFVRQDGRRPKIEEYAGRSELSGWLRVVVLRTILNWLDAQKPEQPFEDQVLEGLVVTDASPELLYGRAEHRETVRRAFARAVAELTARERRVVRLSFIEGFTVDELGSLYGVHRATAARWVKDAVEKLGASARRIAREELGLSAVAYERWANQLGTSMAASIARYLSTTPGTRA